METKKCKKCGKEFPISSFGLDINAKDGHKSWCKNCINEQAHKRYLEKRLRKGDLVPNPKLQDVTPLEMMNELKLRGYSGELTFVEVKTHKIKL